MGALLPPPGGSSGGALRGRLAPPPADLRNGDTVNGGALQLKHSSIPSNNPPVAVNSLFDFGPLDPFVSSTTNVPIPKTDAFGFPISSSQNERVLSKTKINEPPNLLDF